MKKRQVVYDDQARADLVVILNWVAEATSPMVAIGIVERIESFIDRLDIASERGMLKDDIRPGVRVVGYQNANIAFVVEADEVVILRIFYGGQNWEDLLER